MGDQFAIPKPKSQATKIVTEETSEQTEFRKEIALYSLKRAAIRVHGLQRQRLTLGTIGEDRWIEEGHSLFKGYNLCSAEYADAQGVSRGVLLEREGQDSLYTTVGWTGECTVWRVDKNNSLSVATKLVGHKYQVFDVDYHPRIASNDPDTPNIATGGADCLVRLWTLDLQEKEQNCLEFAGHEDRVNRARFHPNGLHLVSASYDKTAQVWDIDKEKSMLKLTGHQAGIHTMSIHPDGSLIVD